MNLNELANLAQDTDKLMNLTDAEVSALINMKKYYISWTIKNANPTKTYGNDSGVYIVEAESANDASAKSMSPLAVMSRENNEELKRVTPLRRPNNWSELVDYDDMEIDYRILGITDILTQAEYLTKIENDGTMADWQGPRSIDCYQTEYVMDENSEIEDEIEHDSLGGYLEAIGDDSVDIDDGQYFAYAGHTAEQAHEAHIYGGFIDTVITPSRTTEHDGNVTQWVNTRSEFPVTVKNGKVDVYELASSLNDAHLRSGYWGNFFEGWHFDSEKNMFTCFVGS